VVDIFALPNVIPPVPPLDKLLPTEIAEVEENAPMEFVKNPP